MGRKAKVPLGELKRLLDQGVLIKDCAAHFGVTPGAVTNAKKRLRVGYTRNAMMEAAHNAVVENLDMAQKVRDYISAADELLETSMAWIRGEDWAIQALESQVRKVRVGRGEDVKDVTEYKFKDPRDIALRAISEGRQLLRFVADVRRDEFDREAADEFRKIVLQAIGEADEATRDKIIRRLQDSRALRCAIQLNPGVDGE